MSDYLREDALRRCACEISALYSTRRILPHPHRSGKSATWSLPMQICCSGHEGGTANRRSRPPAPERMAGLGPGLARQSPQRSPRRPSSIPQDRALWSLTGLLHRSMDGQSNRLPDVRNRNERQSGSRSRWSLPHRPTRPPTWNADRGRDRGCRAVLALGHRMKRVAGTAGGDVVARV